MYDLTFKKCALKEFDFLVSKYGFKCVQSDYYYLRFESDIVFATVQYDPHKSFEMDFSIGRLDDLYDGIERPFYLGEIIRFSDSKKKEDYPILFQASTPERVVRLVPKMAGLTEKYTKYFFGGDKVCFKALSDFREKECDEYALKENLVRIRSAAKEAWNRKDYASVVALYEQVIDYITQLECKQLEYSRKHLV